MMLIPSSFKMVAWICESSLPAVLSGQLSCFMIWKRHSQCLSGTIWESGRESVVRSRVCVGYCTCRTFQQPLIRLRVPPSGNLLSAGLQFHHAHSLPVPPAASFLWALRLLPVFPELTNAVLGPSPNLSVPLCDDMKFSPSPQCYSVTCQRLIHMMCPVPTASWTRNSCYKYVSVWK